MADVRRSSFYLLFIGLILGYALSSLFAPSLIIWYSEPPYQPGVNCTPAIEWGLKQIVRWQMAGMFVLALALWSFSLFVRKKRVADE